MRLRLPPLIRPRLGAKTCSSTFSMNSLTTLAAWSCILLSWLAWILTPLLRVWYANDLRLIIPSYGSSSKIRAHTRVTTKSAISLDVCVTDLYDVDILAGVLACDINDHLALFWLHPNVQKTQKMETYSCRHINNCSLKQFGANCFCELEQCHKREKPKQGIWCFCRTTETVLQHCVFYG